MNKTAETVNNRFVFNTAFGNCGIAVSSDKLVSVVLPHTYPDISFGGASMDGCSQQFSVRVAEKIKRYFSGKRVDFSDIDIQLPFGSEFSHKVLQSCREIAYGEVVSYAQLAKMAGFEGSARAVGNILSRNPIPLVIPCHRVIRADGKPGGFMRNIEGASEIKRRMLALEKSD